MAILLRVADYELPLELPRISSKEFIEFCRLNPDARVERSAEGKLVIMPPAEADGDSRNAEIIVDLGIWNRTLSRPGKTFGPSAGFTLPSGAVRSPDAAWISAERWAGLSESQRKGFAQVCPNFVVELLSPSDSLTATQDKLQEYLASGAQLGLLIDRKRTVVEVYRPNQPVQTLTNPTDISCHPELPGFTLSLERIF